MKRKKPRIRYIYMPDASIATYDYVNHVIKIDEDLKKFPKMRDEAIKHEMVHAMNRFNFVRHFWFDITESFKQATNKKYVIMFEKFKEYKEGKIKEEKKASGFKAIHILLLIPGLVVLMARAFFVYIIAPYRTYLVYKYMGKIDWISVVHFIAITALIILILT